MAEIPNNHLGCKKPVVNNGINYQPQLVYPIIYRVFYIPGGAGFLPSTVSIVEGQMHADSDIFQRICDICDIGYTHLPKTRPSEGSQPHCDLGRKISRGFRGK